MVRNIIGLISGTSADGIDAALVAVADSGVATRVRLLGFEFVPYSPELRREVLALSEPGAGSVDKICRMNAVLGEWFARAALAVCGKAEVPVAQVDLIGSHGQTVHHLPEPEQVHGVTVRSTLQIGDASLIAQRTGITTVADFRARDMAAGGQGAPLVPLVDYLLFRSTEVGRVMLNLGGIANFTVLPSNCEAGDVFAFDTGPGNMVMDALVQEIRGQDFDRDGEVAAAGRVNYELLESLMTHPFLKLAPPKSTGREAFGRPVVEQVLVWRGRIPDEDLVCTAAAFTAQSVADAVRRFVLPVCPVQEVVVSGGGAQNPILMQMLGTELPGTKVHKMEHLGVPSDAKEAVAFAVLANETVYGNPGNLPRVTGASESVILGGVFPGAGARISVDSQGGMF
ncbi:MAG: anhydro-N-acetylmuramic acid kinase [bacterium]|nr:anhydro-N-acetylmuramic acid kinase [bacterium]